MGEGKGESKAGEGRADIEVGDGKKEKNRKSVRGTYRMPVVLGIGFYRITKIWIVLTSLSG